MELPGHLMTFSNKKVCKLLDLFKTRSFYLKKCLHYHVVSSVTVKFMFLPPLHALLLRPS